MTDTTEIERQLTRLDSLIARINDPTYESPPEMLDLARRALEGLKHADPSVEAWAWRLAMDVADAND